MSAPRPGALAAPLLIAAALAPSIAAAAPPAPPPVSIRVVAPSPDPAWTLRIDNEGEEPIRIAADVRLLSLEIAPAGSRAFRPCRPAPGQQPRSFPEARELYLAPGESWVEQFDPRLFCFGREGDLLRGGTVVRFRFGFDPRGGRRDREPFVVQGTRAPATFPAARQLVAPTIVLSHAPAEIAPPPPTPPGVSRANAPLPPVPGPDEPPSSDAPPPEPDAPPPMTPAARMLAAAAAAERLEAEKARERAKEREEGLATTYSEPDEPHRPGDRLAPDLDLYVERWSSGGAPRDLVLRLRAENEGGRALTAVLRSRMLRFRVEGPLTADNQTTATTECLLDERSHAVPVEMVRSLRPGQSQTFPFLLAEVCPRGTFDRPGLYRVTPLLASTIEGEAVEDRDAFTGRVRALQPALARIGSSRLPFYDRAPAAVPTAKLEADDDHEDGGDAGGGEGPVTPE